MPSGVKSPSPDGELHCRHLPAAGLIGTGHRQIQQFLPPGQPFQTAGGKEQIVPALFQPLTEQSQSRGIGHQLPGHKALGREVIEPQRVQQCHHALPTRRGQG